MNTDGREERRTKGSHAEAAEAAEGAEKREERQGEERVEGVHHCPTLRFPPSPICVHPPSPWLRRTGPRFLLSFAFLLFS